MGILSGLVEPQLEGLITKYTYIRGTDARLKFQTKSDLEKRYRPNEKLCELLKINTLLPRPAFISDAIRYIFEDLTIADVLPTQIVPVLRSYGVMCDAVTMTAERKTDNTITNIRFRLYCKKSGRERFVHFGHISLVITSNPMHSGYWGCQYFWNHITEIWRRSESVRLSAIFRRKIIAHKLRLSEKSPASFFKYETYVNS